MMSFVGGYGNGGGSISSLSNLSALAPPFMVERSSVQKPNSNPLVDVNEPQFAPPLNSSLHNWLGFDSMSLPNSTGYGHRYSTATHLPSTDIYPYGQSSSDGNKLAEIKPYYPYVSVSPTIHDDGSLTNPRQAGYDLLSTTNVTTFDIPSPQPEYAQGLSNPKQSGPWGGAWEGMHSWDLGQKKFDGNFVAKDLNMAGSSIYNDYLNQGFHASKGLSSSEEASAPRNGLPSWEQHGDFPGTSIMGSTSLLSETYPQEPSQKTVDSVRRWQIPSRDSHEKRFRQPENDSNKDSHSLSTAEDKIRFDASQLCFHLKQNENMSLEQPLIHNKDPSGKKDVLDNFSNGKFGLQVPNVRPDGFNLSLDSRGESSLFPYSSESVDSPCWRGAHVSYFSPFAASEAVYPKQSKKPDSNFQSENGLAPSPKRPALGNIFVKEHLSDSDTKFGLNYKKPGNDYELNSCCEVDELKNKNGLLTRSINEESSFKAASQSMPQTPEEVMLTFEKNWSTDLTVNVDDVSEGGLSDVPIHAAEQVLCSPSSVEGSVHAKLLKSQVTESSPSVYVQTLLSSIHNLSELLLFHCSNGTSELKEEDGEILKSVISNLEKCINTGQASSTQESIFPLQVNSQGVDEELQVTKLASLNLPYLPNFQPSQAAKTHYIEPVKQEQKVSECPDGSEDMGKNDQMTEGVDEELQVTKVASLNMPHLTKPQLFPAEKKRCIESEKEEQESSERAHGSEDMMKYNQMTKDIKNILMENLNDDEEEIEPEQMLYKNLWLEAEAALCSISYMARFNRMKNEIEKCKSQKMEEKSKHGKKLSTSKFFPGLSPVSELAPEPNVGSSSDPYVQSPPSIGLSEGAALSKISHPNDIMARLNILKCRVDIPNSPESSKISPTSTEVDKFPAEVKSSAFDVEALVMDRFHILKSRANSSSPMNKNSQRNSDEKKQEPVAKDKVEDTRLNINVESSVCGENSTVKDFRVCSKVDPVIQFNHKLRLGDPLPVGWNDSSSSDWEHVLKDELAG